MSHLEHCNLYLQVLSELMNFYSASGWRKGPFLCTFVSSLINTSLYNLQEIHDDEVLLSLQWPIVKNEPKLASIVFSLLMLGEMLPYLHYLLV